MYEFIKELPNNPFSIIAICAIAFWFLSKVFREQISTLRIEREEYKKSLHAEKASHQSTLFKLAEAEQRPNVVSIESLLNRYCQSTEAMMKAYQEHVVDDAKMFGSLNVALSSIPSAIAEQSTIFRDSLQSLSEDFDKRQETILAALMKRRNKQ